jgi:hypothetical protein
MMMVNGERRQGNKGTKGIKERKDEDADEIIPRYI